MSHLNTINWTHKCIGITDIRKLNKLYVIRITDPDPNETDTIEAPLFIKDVIFEERLKSYFLKDIINISRDEILQERWNMYITKGYYIKIHDNGEIEKFYYDAEKWYVSYLEIDGPLGTLWRN